MEALKQARNSRGGEKSSGSPVDVKKPVVVKPQPFTEKLGEEEKPQQSFLSLLRKRTSDVPSGSQPDKKDEDEHSGSEESEPESPKPAKLADTPSKPKEVTSIVKSNSQTSTKTNSKVFIPPLKNTPEGDNSDPETSEQEQEEEEEEDMAMIFRKKSPTPTEVKQPAQKDPPKQQAPRHIPLDSSSDEQEPSQPEPILKSNSKQQITPSTPKPENVSAISLHNQTRSPTQQEEDSSEDSGKIFAPRPSPRSLSAPKPGSFMSFITDPEDSSDDKKQAEPVESTEPSKEQHAKPEMRPSTTDMQIANEGDELQSSFSTARRPSSRYFGFLLLYFSLCAGQRRNLHDIHGVLILCISLIFVQA